MIRVCRNCQNTLDNDEKFCSKCGISSSNALIYPAAPPTWQPFEPQSRQFQPQQAQVPFQQQQYQQLAYEAPPPMPPAKKVTKNRGLKIAAILVLVVLLCCLIFFAIRGVMATLGDKDEGGSNTSISNNGSNGDKDDGGSNTSISNNGGNNGDKDDGGSNTSISNNGDKDDGGINNGGSKAPAKTGIVGTWKATLKLSEYGDMGDLGELEEYIDVDKLVIGFNLKFTDNGKYELTVDSKSIDELVDVMCDGMEGYLKDAAKEFGMSYNELLAMMGVESIRDFLESEGLLDEFEDLKDMRESGKYTWEDGVLTMDGEEVVAKLNGNTLTVEIQGMEVEFTRK